MPGPQDTLATALRMVASCSPVDWSAIETLTDEPSSRSILKGLKVLSKIAEVHGASISLANDPADDVPATWGPLTVLERIGAGSYGVVYRAWDRRLDREVALKLVRDDAEDSTNPIIMEARLLAKVRHPNVVTVHGADRINGRVGIWMEFVEGRTLQEIVASDGPLSAAAARRTALGVARGLAAVHRAGIVHRDVKAQNVVVEANGRVVLTDFGSGQDLRDKRPTAGTPLYLAPEVLRGEPASEQSDVYSLGVLLYFAITGHYPITGDSVEELRAATSQLHRIRIRDRRHNVPAALASVVDRALADPGQRFRTVAELERALARIDRVPSKATTAWVALLAGLVLALVGWNLRLVSPSRPAGAVRNTAASGKPQSVAEFHLRNVTTPSPDALREYSFAAQLMETDPGGNAKAAQTYLTRALEKDPGFASAHMLMAWAIVNQQPKDPSEHLRHAETALALAEGLQGAERNFIVGTAYSMRAQNMGNESSREANLQEAANAFAAVLRDEPDYPWALNNLSHIYVDSGRRQDLAGVLAGLSDSRPDSIRLSAAAADAFLVLDDLAHLEQYEHRARNGMAAGATAQPETVAQLAIIGARLAWLKGDVILANQRLQAAMSVESPDRRAQEYLLTKGPMLAMTMGRLHDAETMASNMTPGGPRDIQLVRILTQRRDVSRLQMLLKPVPPESQEAERFGCMYVDADLLPEAHRLASRLSTTGIIRQALTATHIEAALAVREGRYRDAVTYGKKNLEMLSVSHGNGDDAHVAALMAEAYAGLGRLQAATDLLEERTGNRTLTGETAGGRWIDARLLLGSLYRQAGNEGAASRVEDELSGLLAAADPDFPPLLELKTRIRARQ